MLNTTACLISLLYSIVQYCTVLYSFNHTGENCPAEDCLTRQRRVLRVHYYYSYTQAAIASGGCVTN